MTLANRLQNYIENAGKRKPDSTPNNNIVKHIHKIHEDHTFNGFQFGQRKNGAKTSYKDEHYARKNLDAHHILAKKLGYTLHKKTTSEEHPDKNMSNIHTIITHTHEYKHPKTGKKLIINHSIEHGKYKNEPYTNHVVKTHV